jgi:hypothetical protein
MFKDARFMCYDSPTVYANGLERTLLEAESLDPPQRCILSCAHDVILYSNTMSDERKLKLKKAWLDFRHHLAKHLAVKRPSFGVRRSR